MSEVKKIATRESYGNALIELGKEHENLVVLDADLAAATKTGMFKKVFPERHIDCGIAECNMVGIAAGLVFGISPVDIVLKYVCPIMGGGNGAGAVPLSQIYETVTGDAAANYYSFAIIILTIANMFCIVAGALLNRLGQVLVRKRPAGRVMAPS